MSRPFALPGTVLIAILLSGSACESPPELPRGTLLTGQGPGLAAFLARAESLTGTPLAKLAGDVRAQIAGCDRFVALCDEGCDGSSSRVEALLQRVTCDSQMPDPLPAGLAEAESLRGEADWLLSHYDGGDWGVRVRGTSAADGSTTLDLELLGKQPEGPLALLLPAHEGPGAARLSSRQALAHSRLRPVGGLSLGGMVEAEGWGARMFQLQSDLFLGTALQGIWELAIYEPRDGEIIPPTALALDFKVRTAAVEVMERFVADVQRTWAVRSSPFRLGDADGACLSNLNLMPDLAPCYVATASALVVGWNSRSLELALAGEEAGSGNGGAPDAGEIDTSRLELFVDRFPEADATLARSNGAEPLASHYPWRSVTVRGSQEQKSFRFQARLLPWDPP